MAVAWVRENCKRSDRVDPCLLRASKGTAGRIGRALAQVLLPVMLAGCAVPELRTDVVAFHRWPEVRQPTYRLELTADQRGSVEQHEFASVLRSELASVGFLPAAEGRFLITYGTAQKARREAARNEPPFYGAYWYGGPSSSTAMIGLPSRAEAPSVDPTRADRELTLVIEDTSVRPPRRVYEARASSTGPAGATVTAFKLMARAMLQQFPGPSGATRHVTVESPDLSP